MGSQIDFHLVTFQSYHTYCKIIRNTVAALHIGEPDLTFNWQMGWWEATALLSGVFSYLLGSNIKVAVLTAGWNRWVNRPGNKLVATMVLIQPAFSLNLAPLSFVKPPVPCGFCPCRFLDSQQNLLDGQKGYPLPIFNSGKDAWIQPYGRNTACS